jgi:hypothetical protein
VAHRFRRALVAAALIAGPGGAPAEDKKPVRPQATAGPITPFAGTVTSLTFSPTTASFNSTNPDGTVNASATVVSWRVTGGTNTLTWTLSVRGPASGSFTNCATIPNSAVRVSAPSGTVNGGGGSYVAGGTITLTSSDQQIASGLEGTGTRNYTANVTYTIVDAWRFIPSGALGCTMAVTYTVNAP